MHTLLLFVLSSTWLLPTTISSVSDTSSRHVSWIDSTRWQRLSSATGQLPAPEIGKQQTASLVADLDSDGIHDFVLTERTQAPGVIWYRKVARGWQRYVVDTTLVRIEAGSAAHDIDRDGDLDIVFGGEARSNEVWWWENPSPAFDTTRPWVRHLIKQGGARKHHDQLFGDFDGDGQAELVFWNQEGRTLFLAEIPADPRRAPTWDTRSIYTYSADSQMEQRGSYPGWKRTNEHEGLTSADIDGDGLQDIVGGGKWFKYQAGQGFMPNVIDASYVFTRAAAGQLIAGGRPEVLLVVGDGAAPLMLYEYQKGTWVAREIVDEVRDGHSLDVVDFNGDGHQDIFYAEMNLGQNPQARTRILLGNGTGAFQVLEVARGFDLHEAKIADLDGDGDLDILAKPYNDQTPRIEVWLNRMK